MKTIFLTFLLFTGMTASASVNNLQGKKLICNISYSQQSNPGLHQPWAPLVVDLNDAIAAKTTRVMKILDGDFQGEVQMSLGFSYQGEVAAGNLVGIEVGLAHFGIDGSSQAQMYAGASSTFPLIAESTAIDTGRIEMYSLQKGLAAVEVGCYVK